MDMQKVDQAMGALAQWYRENRRPMLFVECEQILKPYFPAHADRDAFDSYLNSYEGRAKFRVLLKGKPSNKPTTKPCPKCGKPLILRFFSKLGYHEWVHEYSMGAIVSGKEVCDYSEKAKPEPLKPSTLVEPATCDVVSPKYYYLLSGFGIPIPDYSFSIEPEAGERKIDATLKRLKDGVDSIQQSDNYRQYLLTMSKFHDYSIWNLMLIMLQKPTATRVAGFYTWKDLGRYVKAGEHGITVLAPCLPARELPCPLCGTVFTEQALRTHLQEAHGRTDSGLIRQARESGSVPSPYGFKPVTVFDVSQTEGKPLPEVVVPTLSGAANEELFAKMLAVGKAQGVGVSMESRPDQDPEIKGTYIVKSIWVRPEESRAQQLKTLIHEMAHYYTEGVFGIPKADAETTAESTAFVVAAHFGFDTGSRSFPYVAIWSKESKVLERNLATIRKVSKALIEAVEKA